MITIEHGNEPSPRSEFRPPVGGFNQLPATAGLFALDTGNLSLSPARFPLQRVQRSVQIRGIAFGTGSFGYQGSAA
jgi:hypothetical protein